MSSKPRRRNGLQQAWSLSHSRCSLPLHFIDLIGVRCQTRQLSQQLPPQVTEASEVTTKLRLPLQASLRLAAYREVRTSDKIGGLSLVHWWAPECSYTGGSVVLSKVQASGPPVSKRLQEAWLETGRAGTWALELTLWHYQDE